jgi:hypothetical protein
MWSITREARRYETNLYTIIRIPTSQNKNRAAVKKKKKKKKKMMIIVITIIFLNCKLRILNGSLFSAYRGF